MNFLGDSIIHVDLSDKLRTLRVHAELRRHFGRVRKRNVRSEWFIIARGCTEQFRRARDRLSAHFRGHAHASGDEHVAAKSDNRGAGKTRKGHFQWHSRRRSDFLELPLFLRSFIHFIIYYADFWICHERGRLRGVPLQFDQWTRGTQLRTRGRTKCGFGREDCQTSIRGNCRFCFAYI